MSARHPPPVGYAGFVTRVVALIIDAVVIDVVALIAGAVFSWISSLFGGHLHLSLGKAVAGGVLWFLWTLAYFVTFWTLTGQTPGSRLLAIRVQTADGATIGVVRAARRFLGMIIAAIPLGAGFLPVLVDERRRGLHDRIARTVVRWDEGEVAGQVLSAPPGRVAGEVAGEVVSAPPGRVTGEVVSAPPPGRGADISGVALKPRARP